MCFKSCYVYTGHVHVQEGVKDDSRQVDTLLISNHHIRVLCRLIIRSEDAGGTLDSGSFERIPWDISVDCDFLGRHDSPAFILNNVHSSTLFLRCWTERYCHGGANCCLNFCSKRRPNTVISRRRWSSISSVPRYRMEYGILQVIPSTDHRS